MYRSPTGDLVNVVQVQAKSVVKLTLHDHKYVPLLRWVELQEAGQSLVPHSGLKLKRWPFQNVLLLSEKLCMSRAVVREEA